MKLIIINGPNLNLLGIREKNIYGDTSFEVYFNTLLEKFDGLINLEYYQSNHEGELIEKIQEVGFSYDGIIINAGGFTHTSVSIRDAINILKIPIIEDNCESIGAMYKNKYAGNLFDAGVFSFDHGKMIACGEGGMVLTNNKNYAEFVSQYSDHGHENNPKLPRGKDTSTIYGFNYRITEMQGVVGKEQLKKLDLVIKNNKKRYEILKIWKKLLTASANHFFPNYCPGKTLYFHLMVKTVSLYALTMPLFARRVWLMMQTLVSNLFLMGVHAMEVSLSQEIMMLIKKEGSMKSKE